MAPNNCFLLQIALLYFSTMIVSQAISCQPGQMDSEALALQGGRRCVKLMPTTYYEWNLAQQACNADGGHLLHIYSSFDFSRVAAYIKYLMGEGMVVNPPLGNAEKCILIGLMRSGNTVTTKGVGMSFMLDVLSNIGLNLNLMYGAQNLDGVNDQNPRWLLEAVYKYGCIPVPTAMPDPPTFTMDLKSYNILKDTPAYAFCEYENFLPTNRGEMEVFKRQGLPDTQLGYRTNFKSPAHCAANCYQQKQCQGFNIMKFGGGFLCQFSAENAEDANLVISNVDFFSLIDK